MRPAAESGPSVTRALGTDHEWLCELLDRAVVALARGDAERHEAALRSFVRGVRRHLHVEHDVLLPQLERAGEEDATHLAGELEERDEALFRALESALVTEREGRGDEVRTSLLRLRALLRDHGRAMHDTLYPACDRLLCHEARAAAVRELDSKVLSIPPSSRAPRS